MELRREDLYEVCPKCSGEKQFKQKEPMEMLPPLNKVLKKVAEDSAIKESPEEIDNYQQKFREFYYNDPEKVLIYLYGADILKNIYQSCNQCGGEGEVLTETGKLIASLR